MTNISITSFNQENKRTHSNSGVRAQNASKNKSIKKSNLKKYSNFSFKTSNETSSFNLKKRLEKNKVGRVKRDKRRKLSDDDGDSKVSKRSKVPLGSEAKFIETQQKNRKNQI